MFGRTFTTTIRQSVAVEKSQDAQQSIYEGLNKPGRDYESLIDEIINLKAGK